MNFLLIGDIHAKPDNLEECLALIQWVAAECMRLRAIPVFMGDQNDTHGTVRVEVLNFWTWVFQIFLPQVGVKRSVTLIGNHDMNYACSHSSMIPFQANTQLVGQAVEAIDAANGLYAIGYVKGSAAFQEALKSLPSSARIVLCHQEFDGAKYASGFYAPAGVKLDSVPPVKFISGHIHLQQAIGDRVLYVGTPRQVGRSDADPDKSIWHLTNAGLTPIRVPDSVVPRFSRIALREGDAIPSIVAPAKTFVDLYGSLDFIKKVSKQLPEGVRVRTFPDRQAPERKDFKESEGVGKAMVRYMDLYAKDNSLTPEVRNKLVEKLKNLCPGLVG